MNRRSFLKRAGALLTISYVNPLSLAEPLQMVVPKKYPGNRLIHPNEIAQEALALLENDLVFTLNHFSKEFVEPAARKMAEAIDKDMAEQF